MPMKWKRKKTGVYVCGQFLIKGAGRDWKLSFAGEHLGEFTTKKDCKVQAEKENAKLEGDAAEAGSPEPTPVLKTTKKDRGNPEYAKVLDEISQLGSLRASIDFCSQQVSMLGALVNNLIDAVNENTKALKGK